MKGSVGEPLEGGVLNANSSSWQVAPRHPPVLDDGAVHVWRVWGRADAATSTSLERLLSAEERARAGAFRQERDRTRYLLGRGVLRLLLGRYQQRLPAELEFAYNPHGKPALVAVPGAKEIEFNVSHSGDWVLCALARRRAVGIDVEHIRPVPDWDQIAERFFAPGEAAVLRGLPTEARQTAFFHCWVRKEAYVKALGKGLSVPLREFEVSVAPGEPARLLRGHQGGKTWSLRELSLGPEYTAALAVAGEIGSLCCWDWQEEVA
jgi:4'-phosphopantetheinyl transferase